MNIDLPKHHNPKACFDLKEKGHYLRTWEVGVPASNSFEWAVVLSHLTSANLSNDEDFVNRLKDLTDDYEDAHAIRHCISSFNPFLNRYSCFYNKSLQNVVVKFKQRLLKSQQGPSDETQKFETACDLLKSQIKLVTVIENEDIEIRSFPKHVETPKENLRITLYLNSLPDLQNSYNFGLKKEQGNVLKKAAFNKILKEADVLKKRRKSLFLLYKENESFVTSVLKSDCKTTIPYLYRSPYIICKLVEAGFEMDPRVVDSDGFSSFYHAVTSGDESLVYTLHNYAINACHQSNKNFREPDELILCSLKKLVEVINRDKQNSNDFEALDQDARLAANQLIRFNEFLIHMCENILQERKQSDCLITQEKWEASVRKDIILVILKTYDTFFSFHEKTVSVDHFSLLTDYCSYNDYYKNLDYSAALYFFDNIFNLKERLLLNNYEYSELESNFFLSVLSCKFFSREFFKPNLLSHKNSQYQKSFNDYRNTIISSNEKARSLKIIPLLERLCLRKEIRKFIEILSEVPIDDTNVIYGLPEAEIPKRLANLPEVKDELVICRLMYYLETAMKQNVSSLKQSLIIERAVQVLGEFLINGRKNPRSLCFLLSLSLPESVFRLLKQTRNTLSHLEKFSFNSKIKAETDTSLFNGIKKDISKIYDTFKDIFDMQQLRLAEFLFRRGLLRMEEMCTSEFESSEYLLDVLMQLKDEYNQLCEITSRPCYSSTVFKNPNILTNLSNVIDEILRNDDTWKSDTIQENCDKILWLLRYILTLLAKDCKDLNIAEIEELTKNSEEILVCNSADTREKLEIFWIKYKILIGEVCQKTSNAPQVDPFGVSIETFKKRLRGFSFFSEAEQEEILSKIPQRVYDVINIRCDIEAMLEKREQLNPGQIKAIPNLFLTKNQIKLLKANYNSNVEEALEIVRSAINPVEQLKDIFQGGCTTMTKKALEQMCKRLKFPQDIKTELFSLILGEKKKANENRLKSLLNRIKLLREILIEESFNISELWNKAKDRKTQQYAKYKIVQRFVRDPTVQASVEMLLADCMNLLGKKTDMETLWIKASSLFSGINLRNVLGHGNPTLETVGKLLDPNDLPSVLVEEMLGLIRDETVITAMYDLSLKTKSEFGMFHSIMNNLDDAEDIEIKEKIRQCERWQRYSWLLDRKTNVPANA